MNWTSVSNRLDTAVQFICSVKHKKANPFLGSKEGVRCIQKARVKKGVGIADVVPQAGQKRVEDKGGHDGERENRGAP